MPRITRVSRAAARLFCVASLFVSYRSTVTDTTLAIANDQASRFRSKHGVSFNEAASVFADGRALTFADTDHFESEDRSRTYGISNKGGDFSWWFPRNAETRFESATHERRLDMKRRL